MKISIRDEKVKQFEKLNRGELNSQISKILGDAKTPTEKYDESIRLDVESNSDEGKNLSFCILKVAFRSICLRGLLGRLQEKSDGSSKINCNYKRMTL